MKSPMRIAFDATGTPDELTGAGYYVKEILTELDKRSEIELVVLTRKGDKKRFQSFSPNAEIIEVAPSSRPARVAFQTFKLGNLIDSLNVDVFHGPHYQLPLKMNTPSVVTIHDMTLLTHKEVHSRAKREFFSRMIPRSAKQAKSIVTVSQHTADDVKKLVKGHGRIFVAPLGIDSQRFSPDGGKDDTTILSRRGIIGDYVAFIGSFEPRKSIPTLIKAFTKIAPDFPDLRLVLAGGKGWGGNEIRNAIVDSGIATRIVTPGRLDHDEVAPFLRNAKLFVYPSIYEGFGMPVAESMACGTPTITTNSSSLREVAGKGAMLFEPLDIDGLTEIMESLLKHKTLYSQMKSKALSRASDFSWAVCADQHIEAYRFAGDLIPQKGHLGDGLR